MHNSDDKRKNRRQAWMFGFSIVFLFAVLGAILALIFGPEALYFIGTHWIPNLLFFVIVFRDNVPLMKCRVANVKHQNHFHFDFLIYQLIENPVLLSHH